jgi:peptidoglycan/xylan/chitin deacetylase (PgdA/CDA1 family)
MEMRMKTLLFLIILFMFTQVSVASEPSKNFHWPKKIQAAVSLSYDDALESQLDVAIPALNRYQIKASFYLVLSSPTIANRLPEWRAAALQGHELANHTLFHQCARSPAGREWVDPKNDLDKITVAQLEDQILLANTMLYAIDGKRERTFTTPCADLKASGENYLYAIKSEFVAIKSISGDGITSDMTAFDRYAVNVIAPTDVSGAQLIAIVKEGAKKGTMVNITFHGVNGDYLQVSRQAHEELLKFLSDNQETYWTDTFINIMKYVKKSEMQR